MTEGVPAVLEWLVGHLFRPVEDGMTKEPTSGQSGLDDFANQDWRVRTLALRDLIRGGDVAALTGLLGHASPEVRYLSAAALGVLEAESSLDGLHRLLAEDGSSTVRSQAAISIGQIGQETSVGLLEGRAETDGHRDVVPQCRIAIDNIRRYDGDQSGLRAAFTGLDESLFATVKVGDQVPAFTFPTVDGGSFPLAEHLGRRRILLLWVLADWCPVCHHEFLDLIERKAAFRDLDVAVATLECHDVYRSRVMAGREPKPRYWYTKDFPDLSYGDRRWWPHLMDFAGSVGSRLGVDPLAFAVHSEYVNRPSTVIIDTDGTLRMAYHGSFWGDRPSIDETLEMLRIGSYAFVHPQRKRR